MPKLRKQLIEEPEKTGSSDRLDVILELHRKPSSTNGGERGSRTERIAALKEAFDRDTIPIVEAVLRVGGEITGHAWINRTIRARVPAEKLKELAEHEMIDRVGLPRRLKSDKLK